MACRKAKELGYPHELWTTRLLARHAREHGPPEGHACLDKLAQGHIRVSSKQELKDRIMAAMDHFNQDPVVHTWSYKLDEAA